MIDIVLPHAYCRLARTNKLLAGDNKTFPERRAYLTGDKAARLAQGPSGVGKVLSSHTPRAVEARRIPQGHFSHGATVTSFRGGRNELPGLQFFDGAAHGAQRAKRGQSFLGLFTISRVSGHAPRRRRGCNDRPLPFVFSAVPQANAARLFTFSSVQS